MDVGTLNKFILKLHSSTSITSKASARNLDQMLLQMLVTFDHGDGETIVTDVSLEGKGSQQFATS